MVSPTDRQMNDGDHLAMLIYLTAARLRQQRLQAGMVGGLKFRPESHARMRWEGRCAMTLYSSSAVYATCSHGVRLPHKLRAAITSFHQLTASTNRLQLQVDRGGGRRVVVFAVKHYHAAVKSAVHGPLPVARAKCWSAGPATAVSCSRFLQESSRFHSREFRNGK